MILYVELFLQIMNEIYSEKGTKKIELKIKTGSNMILFCRSIN